jgi:uncharacterized protein (TIGR04222 family)
MFETFLSDLSGADFLWLYGGLIAAAIVLGVALPRWLKAHGRDNGVPSTEELAMLIGGRNRFSEAIAANLLGAGALSVDKKTGFKVLQPDAATNSAERAILRQVAPIKWPDITKAIKQDADAVEERLVAQGWFIEGGDAWMMRIVQTLPFLLVIAFGYYRFTAGDAQGEPTGLLFFMMVMTGIAALLRLLILDRKTQGGMAVVKRALRGNSRLKQAPTQPEMGKAVALYGTGVLAGTPFVALHTMRQSTDSGGSSSDSSDGGGGCGGGCGGCGG